MTAKINAVVTPNINIPDTASNGPSSFHRGGNTTSEPAVVYDLRQDDVHVGVAAQCFGSCAKNVLNQRRVGRHDNACRPHPELVNRAESSGPVLKNEMNLGRVELMHVADQR